MKTLQRVAVITAAAFIPMAFTAAVTPAVSRADCDPGSWWDPVTNSCQAPLVPNCPNGWWDPVANTCRPAVGTTPLGCDNGWWWDPVANVCRPPVLPRSSCPTGLPGQLQLVREGARNADV